MQNFLTAYNVVKYLPDIFGEGVKFIALSALEPAALAHKVINYGDTTYSIVKNYNKDGLSEKFAWNSAIDLSKTTVLGVVSKISQNKAPKAIVTIVQGVVSIFINETLKK